MNRSYFESSVPNFLTMENDQILGELARNHVHSLEHQQRNAWISQIEHLQTVLDGWTEGYLFLEYAIPRMGKRADAVLLARGIVFVLEYKVGATSYDNYAIDQVVDYALDLKNFHEASHTCPIVPILVATKAPAIHDELVWESDKVAYPFRANKATLSELLTTIAAPENSPIDTKAWVNSGYKPTPTIIEAAKALYGGHNVKEISRSDAGAFNLTRTANAISKAIDHAKTNNAKTICFVTGVPGSGKTLAGLNLVTQRMQADKDEHAVFLSGNGPLVKVLREALARDEVLRAKDEGRKITKKGAAQRVNAFVQNIHHFRDESLRSDAAPIEKVVVFDEAQRAWTMEQASKFMKNKRGVEDFDMSEPEFLLSVMDRHNDWCVVVCLIGSGQEINTGEAGLSAWFSAIHSSFPHWRVLFSDVLNSPDHSLGEDSLNPGLNLSAEYWPELHLAVNIRSFRAEHVSAFIAEIISGNARSARAQHEQLEKYPVVVSRNLETTRQWLKNMARGTERYGLVASSNALRLKPAGLHVKAKIDPRNWFLNPRNDIRSSCALEDVSTEFDIQGLELDWVGVCWDANFRWMYNEWVLQAFRGDRWTDVNDPKRRKYLANTYRVLLTRARQGMVIFVPSGSLEDHTRPPKYYDGTYDFLVECGVRDID